MAYKELFFVQAFGITSKNRVCVISTQHADDATCAIAGAEACVDRGAPGAIAFSQMIDEKAEDALEPVLLASFGTVPPEARVAA